MASLCLIIDTASKVAQVVIAVVATTLAWRSFTHSKSVALNTHKLSSRQPLTNELFSLSAAARETEKKYGLLFGRHETVDDKTRLRTDWLRKREEVSVRLNELNKFFPGEVGNSLAVWAEIEAEEDSFAINDALDIGDARLALAPVQKMGVKREEFSSALADAFRRVCK
jgi:hypothetical protein